jgi:hypothetical protein
MSVHHLCDWSCGGTACDAPHAPVETQELIAHLERGPEWTTPLVIPLRSSWWSKAREFVSVYRAYRVANGRRYSLWIAWQIAVRGTPF